MNDKYCKHVEGDNCCGCEACVNICPMRAIKIGQNDMRETIPVIDEDKCIKCGECLRVCPIFNIKELKKSHLAYVACRTDNEKRKWSASGGIATLISESMIKNNGIVFGVMWDKYSQEAVFTHAKRLEDLEKFKGSKYVQARTRDLYSEIEKYLKENVNILFVGTPCQISALLNYISVKKVSKETLYTVEIVCHGVCSGEYLKDEISYLAKKKHLRNVNDVRFRCNIKGLDFNFCLFHDENLLYKMDGYRNNYYYAYLNGLSLRGECYKCKYSRKERIGDITIGDMGIQKIIADLPSESNASFILVNSSKGKIMYKNIKSDLIKKRVMLEDIYNKQVFIKPFPRHSQRTKFEDYICEKKSFVEAVKESVGKEINYNRIIKYPNYILRKLKFKRITGR